MKQKAGGLSRRYVTALRNHLKNGPRGSLLPALKVGRRAAALGLETLDLARIHERAAATLKLSGGKKGFIKQAEIFFAEAVTPILDAYPSAKRGKAGLRRLNGRMNQRTLELASANRQLQKGIIRRKAMEAALKKSRDHYSRLLKDSLRLQEGLRQLTYKVLASQEIERKKISLELQDDIAQTLLGINVRLVSLKQEARINTKGLRDEIASTQRLVVKSARSVRRVANEFCNS
jgi:signal transduction histidine kinase